MPVWLITLAALLLVWGLAHRRYADAREIAARIRDGDAEAFRTFFNRHHARLLGYVRSRGVPNAMAEDVVQNAFVYVWTHRDRIDPDRSLRAYLFRIGHTRALNAKRDASQMSGGVDSSRLAPSDAAVASSSAGAPDAGMQRDEVQARIDAAVADLPERRRAVFELCVLHGLTYADAADVLDIARKTVENHMGRALKDLRNALRDLSTSSG